MPQGVVQALEQEHAAECQQQANKHQQGTRGIAQRLAQRQLTTGGGAQQPRLYGVQPGEFERRKAFAFLSGAWPLLARI